MTEEQNKTTPPTHSEESRAQTSTPVQTQPRVPRYDLRREALESHCTITAVRGSGPGGQHRNKSYTGVRLVHEPSGEVVTATERRSFHQNREAAFTRLTQRLARQMHRPKKRKPTRVTKAPRRKRLERKKRRSERKSSRSKVSW